MSDIVSLSDKEQAKLTEIAKEYTSAQRLLVRAQGELQQLSDTVEQQKGRIQGALEVILANRDLDPASHRWEFDGDAVNVRRQPEPGRDI